MKQMLRTSYARPQSNPEGVAPALRSHCALLLNPCWHLLESVCVTSQFTFPTFLVVSEFFADKDCKVSTTACRVWL